VEYLDIRHKPEPAYVGDARAVSSPLPPATRAFLILAAVLGSLGVLAVLGAVGLVAVLGAGSDTSAPGGMLIVGGILIAGGALFLGGGVFSCFIALIIAWRAGRRSKGNAWSSPRR
jgi:hypothetical protein